MEQINITKWHLFYLFVFVFCFFFLHKLISNQVLAQTAVKELSPPRNGNQILVPFPLKRLTENKHDSTCTHSQTNINMGIHTYLYSTVYKRENVCNKPKIKR